MANFTTHIAVGTVVSGVMATLTLAADVVAPENLVAVTLAGVLGSVLPDIDLRDSRPAKLMWSGLGVFFSFAVLFVFATQYSVVELWILWLGTLIFVRYGMQAIFDRTAVHRGIWHSILAAVFMGIVTAIVFRHVGGRHEGVSWLAGGFMLGGYLTHLILDEMYSVDIMDRRIKASFGTALKLVDTRHPLHSAALAAVTVVALLAAPPMTTFVEGISSRSLWTELNERMLPKGKWFGVFDLDPLGQRLARSLQSEPTAPAVAKPGDAARRGSAIETGSIAPQDGDAATGRNGTGHSGAPGQ